MNRAKTFFVVSQAFYGADGLPKEVPSPLPAAITEATVDALFEVLGSRPAAFYGAHVPGSAFPALLSFWNVNRIGSLLEVSEGALGQTDMQVTKEAQAASLNE